MDLNRTSQSTLLSIIITILLCGAGEPLDYGKENTSLPAPTQTHFASRSQATTGDELSLESDQNQRVVLHLFGGQEVSGELIHIYDHSIWWKNPSSELTYAIFDPDNFAPYPDDRSMSFVSSLDVESISTAPAHPEVPSYRDVLRRNGIVIERSPLNGVAYVLTGHESYHLEENGYGDFAWDLSRTNSRGRRYRRLGLHNADYLVWNDRVFLPTSGYVVEVVRDAADNTPGSYEPDAVNNMVGVHLGGSYYLYLLHFRQGSIPHTVQVGTWLPRGAYLGRVGNSGVSLEPHLHMTLLWYDEHAAQPRTWSVPSEFTNIHTSDQLGTPSHFQEYSVPTTGIWISSDPF